MNIEPYIPQIINAVTAVFSGLSGVVAGGWVTFRVQRGLAQKLRDDNRSAVAAMFVADIRMMNEWLRRTNLLKGVQHLRDALSKGKRSDPAFLALLKLFEINVTELDETMFRKQASLAGALGLLAADVAIVYTSAISLQSNVQALLGDLYQEFTEAMNEIVEKDPRSSVSAVIRRPCLDRPLAGFPGQRHALPSNLPRCHPRNLLTRSTKPGQSLRTGNAMDRIGNGGNGFEAFMIFMIGLSAIGASISIYFTGL